MDKQYNLKDGFEQKITESEDFVSIECECGQSFSFPCKRGPYRDNLIEKLKRNGFTCEQCAQNKARELRERKDIDA